MLTLASPVNFRGSRVSPVYTSQLRFSCYSGLKMVVLQSHNLSKPGNINHLVCCIWQLVIPWDSTLQNLIQISLNPKYNGFDKIHKWTRELVIRASAQETWLIQLQQKFPSHCLWITPKVNFSQATLISGLRKHKAREAKTLTQVGKATFWLGFLRNRRYTYQITNH